MLMNRGHLCFCLTLPLFLLLTASCGQKGVALAFKYPAGFASQYHLLSDIRTRTTTGAASTNHRVSIDMVVNYRVQKVLQNNDAEVLFTYDKIRYLNTQNPEETEHVIEKLRTLQILMTLSPSGEITAAKGYEGLPKMYVNDFNIFTLLFKALPVFPRTPIALGKNWDRQQEYPIENGLVKGNMMVFKRFAVQDTLSGDAARLAKISMEISMKFDVPQSEAFSLRQDGTERLGMFGKGSIRFDRGEGQVREATALVFGKFIIALKHPVTGQDINSKIEIAQNLSVTRL
ncbi:MAG: hypothetical protein V1913_18560 [Fibrobacterota bacterium]